MNRLPATGSNQLLDLLDPYIPDDFISDLCNLRPVRGPHWQFSPAQLWRTHLLAFGLHTLQELSDESYQQIRATLGRRQRL